MEILQNVPLSTLTYYQIGGIAKTVLKVKNASDLLDAMRYIREHNEDKVQVIGYGANLLLSDDFYDGCVIWFSGDGKSLSVEGEKIKAFAGETFDDLIRFSLDNNLVGVEWAGGLPSSVGGAVRGNAGSFGHEVKDAVIEVEAIDLEDESLEVKKFDIDQSKFSYRNSYFKDNKNMLIVSVTFSLKKATDEEVEKAQEVYQENIDYRLKNHPMEYPSCGSVFKNIVDPSHVQKIIEAWPDIKEQSETKWHGKVAVGYVINRLGFSGKKIGGAMVSPKHGNYIVNVDNAKAVDVLALINEISDKFEETFGFPPQPEVVVA